VQISQRGQTQAKDITFQNIIIGSFQNLTKKLFYLLEERKKEIASQENEN